MRFTDETQLWAHIQDELSDTGIVGISGFRIWVDTPIEKANASGQARDQAFQSLWENVWVPNDLDFENKHKPEQYSDAFFSWCD